MKIDIYCHSVTLSPDQPTMMSGCAIRLVTDSGFERILSFGLGSSDANRSMVTTLRLALSAIMPKHRTCTAVLHCADEMAFRLLCKIGRKYQYDYHIDTIEDLRRIADTYKDLYVTCASDEIGSALIKLAEDAAAYQKSTDSGANNGDR